jgi:hypothetical protein
MPKRYNMTNSLCYWRHEFSTSCAVEPHTDIKQESRVWHVFDCEINIMFQLIFYFKLYYVNSDKIKQYLSNYMDNGHSLIEMAWDNHVTRRLLLFVQFRRIARDARMVLFQPLILNQTILSKGSSHPIPSHHYNKDLFICVGIHIIIVPFYQRLYKLDK